MRVDFLEVMDNLQESVLCSYHVDPGGPPERRRRRLGPELYTGTGRGLGREASFSWEIFLSVLLGILYPLSGGNARSPPDLGSLFF